MWVTCFHARSAVVRPVIAKDRDANFFHIFLELSIWNFVYIFINKCRCAWRICHARKCGLCVSPAVKLNLVTQITFTVLGLSIRNLFCKISNKSKCAWRIFYLPFFFTKGGVSGVYITFSDRSSSLMLELDYRLRFNVLFSKYTVVLYFCKRFRFKNHVSDSADYIGYLKSYSRSCERNVIGN